MKKSSCYHVLLDPTPEQAKALALQIVAVNKISNGCMKGTGNPFGQAKDTFKLQYGVDLWASVNMAMMGFSEANLQDKKWRRQINYRGASNGLSMYYDSEHDWGVYLPQLEVEANLGRLRGVGEPLHLPPAVRPMYMTIGVTDDKRWWADIFATSKPPQTYAKRRKF